MPTFFPERQATPNPWQIIGQGLQSGAGLLTQYDDDKFKEAQQRNLLQDMVEKRTQAKMEAVLREQEAARQAEEFKWRQAAAKKAEDFDVSKKQFQEFAAPQQVPTGPVQPLNEPAPPSFDVQQAGQGFVSPLTQPQFQEQPRTREELMAQAAQLGVYGDPGINSYIQDLQPKAPAASEKWAITEVDGNVVQVNPITGEQRVLGKATPKSGDKPTRWAISEVNGRKVQVNPETGEQRDLGPITPKLSGKDMVTAKTKLQMLAVARNQMQAIKDAYAPLKNSFSAGIGGKYLPTPSGKKFDAAVDAFRNTLTGLTRVPGVGAQSDFESRLTQAPLPTRNDYEDVGAQKIKQLDDLVNTLENGYSGMLTDSQGGDEGDTGQPQAPTLAAKPGLKAIDGQVAADYLKRAGGDRKKAKLMLKKDGYDIDG